MKDKVIVWASCFFRGVKGFKDFSDLTKFTSTCRCQHCEAHNQGMLMQKELTEELEREFLFGKKKKK